MLKRPMIPNARARARWALATAIVATWSVAAMSSGCSDNTPPSYEEDYDAGTRPRDAAPRIRRDGGDPNIEGNVVCTATPCITQLSVGGEHACVLTSDRRVLCWGANRYGQLAWGRDADGGVDTSTQAAPVPASGLGPVRDISAGWFHTCALLDDGTVWCWGDNRSGQAGFLPGTDPHPQPTQVFGLPSDVDRIVCGGWHTCALTTSGNVYCWGLNSEGQTGAAGLPDGGVSSTKISTPTRVQDLEGVTELAPGGRFTCVRLGVTDVRCFGTNSDGQNGRGATDYKPHTVPAGVLGLEGAVAKLPRAGGYHVALVLEDGRVQGWGTNGDGEIGIEGINDITVPTLVPGIGDVIDVAAGNGATCIRTQDGSVRCWGRNGKGQVGLPPSATDVLTPNEVALPLPAAQIGAGLRDYACALLDDGHVWCWGSNSDGQLGRGSMALSEDPTPAVINF